MPSSNRLGQGFGSGSANLSRLIAFCFFVVSGAGLKDEALAPALKVVAGLSAVALMNMPGIERQTKRQI